MDQLVHHQKYDGAEKEMMCSAYNYRKWIHLRRPLPCLAVRSLVSLFRANWRRDRECLVQGVAFMQTHFQSHILRWKIYIENVLVYVSLEESIWFYAELPLLLLLLLPLKSIVFRVLAFVHFIASEIFLWFSTIYVMNCMWKRRSILLHIDVNAESQPRFGACVHFARLLSSVKPANRLHQVHSRHSDENRQQQSG